MSDGHAPALSSLHDPAWGGEEELRKLTPRKRARWSQAAIARRRQDLISAIWLAPFDAAPPCYVCGAETSERPGESEHCPRCLRPVCDACHMNDECCFLPDELEGEP